jgi:hypothetical protein
MNEKWVVCVFAILESSIHSSADQLNMRHEYPLENYRGVEQRPEQDRDKVLEHVDRKRRIAHSVPVPHPPKQSSDQFHTTQSLIEDGRSYPRASCDGHSPIQPGRSPRQSPPSQVPLGALPGTSQSSVEDQIEGWWTHLVHPGHTCLQGCLRKKELD